MSRHALEAAKVERKKKLFLEAFRKTGNVSISAMAAGWANATTARTHAKTDPVFQAEWDNAEEHAADAFEQEARRRSEEGYLEPVMYQGRQVFERHPIDHPDKKKAGALILDAFGDPVPVMIRKYSDRLMEIMLKGMKPEKYREHMKVDHEVRGGVMVVGMMGAPSEAAKAIGCATWEEEMKAKKEGRLLAAPLPLTIDQVPAAKETISVGGSAGEIPAKSRVVDDPFAGLDDEGDDEGEEEQGSTLEENLARLKRLKKQKDEALEAERKRKREAETAERKTKAYQENQTKRFKAKMAKAEAYAERIGLDDDEKELLLRKVEATNAKHHKVKQKDRRPGRPLKKKYHATDPGWNRGVPLE